MANKKIDRDIIIKLPAAALAALRKDIAETVVKGIEDGFKKSKKAKSKDKKVDIGSEERQKLKSEGLLKETSETTKKLAAMRAGFKKLSAIIGVAVQAIEAFMKIMEHVEKRSLSAISHNSLFTDKNTMDMMQRTGQSASESAATQRALDTLGISLSDIQSGKITASQMEMFHRLREEHINSIEQSNRVSEGMFLKWQEFAVKLSTMRDMLGDKLTQMLGESGAIEKIVDAVTPLIDTIFGVLEDLMPLIGNILNMIVPLIKMFARQLGIMRELLKPVIAVVSWLVQLVTEVLNFIDQLNNAVYNMFKKWLGWIGIKLPDRSENTTSYTISTANTNNTHQVVNQYNQTSNDLWSNQYGMVN